MAKIANSIGITGLLAPKDDQDTYALYDSQYMKGGYHEVATLADRDAIPAERRRIMMMVAVAADKSTYQLLNGLTNADWVQFIGGGSGSGDNQIRVATLADRDNIPEEDRFEGMDVLVYNEPTLNGPTVFYLVGGIENTDWVQQAVPSVDPNTIKYRGAWQQTVTYAKGDLVYTPAHHYYTRTIGDYSQKATLVCTVEASTPNANAYPPLTEFMIVGAFDFGNVPVTTSVTHGLVWTDPGAGNTNSYEYGNLVLVPSDGLYICIENIDSEKPGRTEEASSWQLLQNFTATYTKAEVDTKIQTIETAATALTTRVDTIDTTIADLQANFPYFENDLIRVKDFNARNTLPTEKLKDGLLVFIYDEDTLNSPTFYMYDLATTSWVEQEKLDPNALVWKEEWIITNTYKKNSVVVFNDIFYLALTENTGKDPSDALNATDWKPIGGAESKLGRDEAAYSTVGNVAAGTNMKDWTWKDYVIAQHYPYQAPAFSSFAIQSQSMTLEVGDTIPANLTFTYGTTNASNIQSGGFTITDVTESTSIITGVTASPVTTTSASVTKNVATNQTYRISGTDTKNNPFNKEVTIAFKWAMFLGEHTGPTITEAEIKALRSKTLNTTSKGTLTFNAGGYKVFAYPTSWGQVTGFKDAETGFSVAMQEPVVLSITNDFGIATNYYVFVTVNQSAAGLVLVVS